jgi:cytoskeleton protein RodZ
LLIICVLLAVITYGGWYYLTAKPGRLADIVPGVPERLHRLLNPPAPQPANPTPEQTAAAVPAAASPAAAVPAAPQSVPSPAPATTGTATVPPTTNVTPAAGTPAPPPVSVQQQAAVDGVPPVDRLPAATPAAPPASPDLTQPAVSADGAKPANDGSYGAPDGEARVVLHATSDSWIQVRDKASNLLFTRVLKPGEHYNVPNQPGLTMIAGNAGGLDITVDGVNVAKIGDAGRVARNVSLDPDRLLGTPTHVN